MITQLSPEVHQLYFPEFGSCVYLLRIGKDNILIDTSSRENGKKLLEDLNKLKIDPRDIHIILLTHKHWDHTGNLDIFPNAKIYSYENINELALIFIKIIPTPGHTKDSLSYLYNDILFSGDTSLIPRMVIFSISPCRKTRRSNMT